MKVYLDLDGVLLGVDRERPSRVALADHAVTFLRFAVTNFDVSWLTPLCRGTADAAVRHLVQHSKLSDREQVMTLASKVRATTYRDLRTEALPADGKFVWFDDQPEPGEMAWLKQRGWLDRWQWIDTREEPEDLLRALEWLRGRASGVGGEGS